MGVDPHGLRGSKFPSTPRNLTPGGRDDTSVRINISVIVLRVLFSNARRVICTENTQFNEEKNALRPF